MANSRARTSAARKGSGVDFDDAGFQAGLREAAERLVVDSERQLRRIAITAQNNARRFCPVDTGRLRASISFDEGHDAHGYWVEIGTNVSYAPYVEFGTAHSAAQPFLRPGVLAAVRQGWGR